MTTILVQSKRPAYLPPTLRPIYMVNWYPYMSLIKYVNHPHKHNPAPRPDTQSSATARTNRAARPRKIIICFKKKREQLGREGSG